MDKQFTYELTAAQIKVLHAGLIHLLDSEDHTDSEEAIITALCLDFEMDKERNPLAFK